MVYALCVVLPPHTPAPPTDVGVILSRVLKAVFLVNSVYLCEVVAVRKMVRTLNATLNHLLTVQFSTVLG
jgi:hypothetical protein